MIGGAAVLAVITARGGSKGIPGKNIVEVGGRPLIRWTIDAAQAARNLDRIIVSTDDPTIAEVARRAHCEVPFLRAPELSTDQATSVDVMLDAVARLPGYDVVVMLQPTSPLRIAADIDGALAMMEGSGAPSCVSIRPAIDHPYLSYRTDAQGRLTPFAEVPRGKSLRRQDLPPAWCLNGAVYAARTTWLCREGTFVGPETVGYMMPAERSLDVDTPTDLDVFRTTVDSTRSSSKQP